MHSKNKSQGTQALWRDRTGFSLIEVVVAVGIFAIAIVGVIALLSPVNQSVAEVGEADDAARLVGVIQAKLQNLSFNTVKLALKNADPDSGSASYDPTSDLTGSFFANREGSILGPYTTSSPDIWSNNGAIATQREKDAQKFFELVLIRNEALSPSSNDDTAGYLAFNIRLRWPAFAADGNRITDRTQQSVLIIPAAITR